MSVGHLRVPGAGIEPARIAPLVFETSASTDSAIRAGVNCFEKCKGIVIFRNCKIIHIGVGIFHTFPWFLWKVPITKAYILSVTPRSLLAYNLPEVFLGWHRIIIFVDEKVKRVSKSGPGRTEIPSDQEGVA